MVYSWKISGEAGFGITTIGLSLAKLIARRGFDIWAYAEYPSLIRGGFTTYELTISNDQYRTQKKNLDFHICLKQDGYDRDKHRLHSGSIVLFDKDIVKVDETLGLCIPVPYKDIKAKHKAFQVMVNTVSIGATYAIFGWNIEDFYQMLRDEFARKGPDVIEFNIKLAKEGYDYIQTMLESGDFKKILHSKTQANFNFDFNSNDKKAVMTGNDGFSIASMVASIRGYFAYPMSPASTVLSTLATYAKSNRIVVRHVEDEIAAINEALGFSYAGARVSVGTSGGGFALMVEGVSYAGVAEMPIVVFLAQRPGPATGLPTWTGQGDLMFAVHSGHGEFMRVILAPGDLEEMFEIGAASYNIADVFQTPVIVITDKLLSESHFSINTKSLEDFRSTYTLDRGKIVSKTDKLPYKRFADENDGISELLIPGRQDGTFWQANSYEHLEDSHTTEEASETIKQVDKRARKIDTYLASKYYKLPKVYGNISDSKYTFVSYGTNKGAIIEAMKELENLGIKTSYIHFTHLLPLNIAEVSKILVSANSRILVENSNTGQLGKLLMQEGCVQRFDNKILKYDGRPIWSFEIVNFIQKL